MGLVGQVFGAAHEVHDEDLTAISVLHSLFVYTLYNIVYRTII